MHSQLVSSRNLPCRLCNMRVCVCIRTSNLGQRVGVHLVSEGGYDWKGEQRVRELAQLELQWPSVQASLRAAAADLSVGGVRAQRMSAGRP